MSTAKTLTIGLVGSTLAVAAVVLARNGPSLAQQPPSVLPLEARVESDELQDFGDGVTARAEVRASPILIDPTQQQRVRVISFSISWHRGIVLLGQVFGQATVQADGSEVIASGQGEIQPRLGSERRGDAVARHAYQVFIHPRDGVPWEGVSDDQIAADVIRIE